MSSQMQFEVRAFPAHGHETRLRAGRAWGKPPVIVTVVDEPDPEKKDQITPEQLVKLRDDPMIAVAPVGAATTGDVEIVTVKAALSERTRELADARAKLGEAIEQIEAMRREMTGAERVNAAKVKQLEDEVAALKAKATKK